MINDLLIINRIREGDIKAFEALFHRYYSPLCIYVASITGSMEVGEEIIEELFYILWRDRKKISILQSAKSYLYKCARNGALQFCAHAEVKARYKDAVLKSGSSCSVLDPQRQVELKELQLIIDGALNKLPERRLKIFCMHRNDGKKYIEIAQQLSLSVKTIESEISKALHTIKKEIENYI